MRGFTLRAGPVCFVAFAAGCFSLGGAGTPAAPRTATHAYWQAAGAALAKKPAGGDMKSMVQLVRAQTDALRALSGEGVDPDLVAAVEAVITCEERVLDVAGTANNDAAIIRGSKGMAEAFGGANRQAAEAKKRLRALRGTLNDRHGGGFDALGG